MSSPAALAKLWDRLSALPAQLERLIDRGPYDLPRLFERVTLGLDLGKLGYMNVDEASLVALEVAVNRRSLIPDKLPPRPRPRCLSESPEVRSITL